MKSAGASAPTPVSNHRQQQDDNNKKRKKRKKKQSARVIPLVKGATAASLAKKQAIIAIQNKAAAEDGPGRKRKKRNREINTRSGLSDSRKNKPSFSSTAESLAVISKYHTLNKRLEQNEHDETITEHERERNARQIKKEQEAMGGLDRYQKASMYGAKSSKFVCADWVVPLLQKQRANATNTGHDGRLRVLDVGAIDNQYHDKGYDDWLDVVPIDLHGGQHESVVQIDFFDYAHGYCCGRDAANAAASEERQETESPPLVPFDAIVMSLVLNFQGDPRKRGDMLALAADPRLLKEASPTTPGGLLFVALPSASLDNSRYCDLDRFVEVTTNTLFGLELVEKKRSSKLVLLTFRRKAGAPVQKHKVKRKGKLSKPGDDDDGGGGDSPSLPCVYDPSDKTFDYGEHEMKRLQPAKSGAKRNNFAVILKSSHTRS